jgi:3-deoxy-7-phosphoheptulonate synthase
LVPALARAAVAVGADGLLIEVHPFPEKAFSDGAQSLTLDQFRALTNDLRPYLELWKASRVCAAAAV